MEVSIPTDLQAKLTRLAAQQGRDANSLVVEAVERLVDCDEELVAEVEEGLAQIEQGRTLSHEEVGARIDKYFPLEAGDMRDLYLHEAIETVLLEQPDKEATTSFLADEIAKRGLYIREKDGKPAGASQINARVRNHPDKFEFVAPGIVRLKTNS